MRYERSLGSVGKLRPPPPFFSPLSICRARGHEVRRAARHQAEGLRLPNRGEGAQRACLGPTVDKLITDTRSGGRVPHRSTKSPWVTIGGQSSSALGSGGNWLRGSVCDGHDQPSSTGSRVSRDDRDEWGQFGQIRTTVCPSITMPMMFVARRTRASTARHRCVMRFSKVARQQDTRPRTHMDMTRLKYVRWLPQLGW